MNNNATSYRKLPGVRFVLSVIPIVFSSLVSANDWMTEYSLSGIDSVHIYLPETPPVIDDKRALMINLHGCSMSNTDMKENAGWEPIADELGMVVALPDVPGDGVYSACWDYYGLDHSRNNKFNGNLINLALELIGRKNLNIDSNQVYISGFSSGGTQAGVVGCLAPDIFSGVGTHSAPGLGTSSNEFKRMPSSYSVFDMAGFCDSLAGDNADKLSTQIYSTIHGAMDKTVDVKYNDTGSKIMSIVYGASNQRDVRSIPVDGEELIFSDAYGARISKILVGGVSHDWMSSGGNTGYFVNDKVDYPDYLTRWLFSNNRRVTDRYDPNESWVCNEFTSTNSEHYNSSPRRVTYERSGRNINYYAIGSDEILPGDGDSVNTLAEISFGYFVVGVCP